MLRNRSLLATLAMALGLSTLLAGAARCDDVAQASKDIVSKWQNAVITVQITAKTSATYEGQAPYARESKSEETGVVIDPSGLVVMSLASTTPEGLYSQLTPEDTGNTKISSEITDLKFLMPDGRQIPGKIVLRDKDLDLAFLRPTDKPSQPFTALDLSKASKPGVMDQIVQLDRLGMIGGRTITADADRINAVIEKPRTFYVAGVDGLGGPVFTLDGNVVGIMFMRIVPGTATAGEPPYAPMILPAGDILEAAKQAPETAK